MPTIAERLLDTASSTSVESRASLERMEGGGSEVGSDEESSLVELGDRAALSWILEAPGDSSDWSALPEGSG